MAVGVQLCACARPPALAPKASSSAGIKVLMFYLSRLKVLGRLSPPDSSVMEGRSSVHGLASRQLRWIAVVVKGHTAAGSLGRMEEEAVAIPHEVLPWRRRLAGQSMCKR